MYLTGKWARLIALGYGASLLCNAEGDAAGGGGEGGDAAPKYVTEDQLNKAIGNRLKAGFDSFKKEITGSIAETIGGLTSQLDAALDAKLEKFAAPPKDAAGKDKDKGGTVDIDNHPTVKGLLRQLEEQKKATDKVNAEAETARQRVADQDLRAQLSTALNAAGVKDPARLRLAVGNLVDAEKRVRWSEDGKALIYNDPTDGDVDLGSGLAGWAKTEDAKLFLSPNSVQGSGDKAGGKGPNAGAKRPYTPGSFGQEIAASMPGMNLMIGPKTQAK
jgi:predicted  nucleic acid-binding Zn-ribbon protein